MKAFHSDKDICMHLRVYYDNQERLKHHVAQSFVPLFALKRDQFFNIRFEYKNFTCTYQGKKQEFLYKDIRKIETITDGLIIYLDGDKYISIATEKIERHNSELYDVVAFLKRYNRRIFSERAEITYPDDAEGRYKSDTEPISKISFELSEKEITRLLWYDYLIDEKMLALILPIFVGLFVAVVLQNIWIAILAGFVLILTAILTVMFLEHKDSYVRNHQGLLYALLYDDLLVIRLHNTDLELEYSTMKHLKNAMGLWRMKSGNFFVLTLPKRVESENASFFDELYQKISKDILMTFPIDHFENKRNFFAAFNGGKLCVTDDEYILKWLFVKIRFPKDKTEIVLLYNWLIWECYCFKVGKKIWEIWFLPKIAEEFSKFIK